MCVCLQTTVPPQGISNFTEDSLLRHAQYIVDTVIVINYLHIKFVLYKKGSVHLDF